MASPEHDALAGLLRSLPRDETQTPEERRVAFDAALGALPPAPDVAIRPEPDAPLPADRHHPPAASTSALVLYLHGGAYTVGSPTSHRASVSFLAEALGIDVVVVDYRLAPEDPFPAALDDALVSLRWAMIEAGGASRLIIAGDSAGGGLALAALLAARDHGLPMPAAALLFSPWTDLRCSSPSWESNAATDPALDPANLRRQAGYYLAGHDPADPLVSPALGEFQGFPPLFAAVGGAELLRDDTAAVIGAAERAGVPTELVVGDGCMHAYALFPQLPESADARSAAAAFTQKALAG